MFSLPVYLVQHHARAISKEKLFHELWPGPVVGEATLASVVQTLRRAIGDDGHRQAMIETVRGHGYRFVGELDVVCASVGVMGGLDRYIWSR
jgi:DNA-binding winged helix-turn-helix (wHTH) protein